MFLEQKLASGFDGQFVFIETFLKHGDSLASQFEEGVFAVDILIPHIKGVVRHADLLEMCCRKILEGDSRVYPFLHKYRELLKQEVIIFLEEESEKNITSWCESLSSAAYEVMKAHLSRTYSEKCKNAKKIIRKKIEQNSLPLSTVSLQKKSTGGCKLSKNIKGRAVALLQKVATVKLTDADFVYYQWDKIQLCISKDPILEEFLNRNEVVYYVKSMSREQKDRFYYHITSADWKKAIQRHFPELKKSIL